MGKRFGASPGHSKHHMQRDRESLRTVNMCKARRVGNYGIGNKRDATDRIVIDAGFPATRQHLRHHCPLTLDLPVTQSLHLGDQTGIFHHICHQLGWVSSNRVELQARLGNKIFEYVMGGQTHAVAVQLKLIAQGNKWLHITSASDNLNNNIQMNVTNSTSGRMWEIRFLARRRN